MDDSSKQPSRFHKLSNLLNSIGSCAYLILNASSLEEARSLADRIQDKAADAASVLRDLRPPDADEGARG